MTGNGMSFASGVSADGNVIVGSYFNSQAVSHGFLWTTENGMVSAKTYMEDVGVNMTGWTIDSIEDVSADGKTFVGSGTFNGTSQAFVASVPEPSSLSLLLVGGAVLMAGRRRR